MNRAIHFKTALKAFTVFLLTAFLPTTAFSQADLKINEIKPWVGDGGTMDSLAAIIEIFNAGDSVQELTGWEIATDSNVITLPSWSLPALGYLQIQLIAGTNDSILNDGMGLSLIHI